MKPPECTPLPWIDDGFQGIEAANGNPVTWADSMTIRDARRYAIHAANSYPLAIKLLGESLFILQHVDVVGEKLKEDIMAFLKDAGKMPQESKPKFHKAILEEDSMPEPRFCWHKDNDYSHPTHECYLDGKLVAIVQQGENPDQWYSYGGGYNSLGNNGSYKSLEDCKKDVVEQYTKNPWELS